MSIVLFFTGAMHFLISCREICGSIPLLNGTEMASVATARDLAAEHLANGDDELIELLTASCLTSKCSTLFDFTYTTVVTVSTVGYGDFAPPDQLTRALATLLIMVLVIYVPMELSALIKMARDMREFCIGSPPRSWHNVIALVGPISPQQLSMFIFDFLHEDAHPQESHTRIMVLSPRAISDYRATVYQAQQQMSKGALRRLYIERSDVLSIWNVPLSIRRAKAVFVFSDSEAAAATAEDRHAVIRCLVLRKLLPQESMRSVFVQFNRALDKMLAVELEVRTAIALNELKMALLAVSATRCFGLTTLVCNMLRTQPVPLQAGHPAAGTEELNAYLRGESYAPYIVKLPACCVHRKWKEVLGSLYIELRIILLGHISDGTEASGYRDGSVHGSVHGRPLVRADLGLDGSSNGRRKSCGFSGLNGLGLDGSGHRDGSIHGSVHGRRSLDGSGHRDGSTHARRSLDGSGHRDGSVRGRNRQSADLDASGHGRRSPGLDGSAHGRNEGVVSLKIDPRSETLVSENCTVLALAMSEEHVEQLRSLTHLPKHGLVRRSTFVDGMVCDPEQEAQLEEAHNTWQALVHAEDERATSRSKRAAGAVQATTVHAPKAQTACVATAPTESALPATAPAPQPSAATTATTSAANTPQGEQADGKETSSSNEMEKKEPAAASLASTGCIAPPSSSFKASSFKKGLGALVSKALYAARFDQVLVPEPYSVDDPFVGGRPFVLAICGAWPANLRIFVETAIGGGEHAVVLLCSVGPPTASDEHLLCRYLNGNRQPLVRLVVGDVRSRPQLIRAGLQHAHSVVILSAFRGTGASSETASDAAQCDMDVSLLQAKVKKAALEQLEALADAQSDGGASERDMTAPIRWTRPLLTEVRNSDAIRFLDESSWWPAKEKDDFSFVQAPACEHRQFEHPFSLVMSEAREP